MAREIAVFFGNTGSTAPLDETGVLAVFQRQQRVWKPDRESEFCLSRGQGLKDIRRQLANLVQLLGDCKILVARTVTGVPYYELEKAGVSVWEIEGDPYDDLEDLWEQDQALRTEEARRQEPEIPGPVEVSPGHYTISIKELQEKDYGVTSKQVLLPFVRKGEFQRLEIICSHVPPWLETEMATGPFAWTMEQIGRKEVKATIRR